MEGDIPAEGTAPVEPVETPTAAGQAPAAPPASTTEAPAATQKPDLAALLSDPETRQELLKHPDIAKDIDRELQHRFASERGRVRAEMRAEIERLQQEQTTRAERERQLQMDELDLGTQRKEELLRQQDNEAQERALQARLQPLQADMETRLLARHGQEVLASVYEMAQEAGATAEELQQLNPATYASLGEYVKGAVKFLSSREGKKLAKEMAKTEAQAIIEERARSDGQSSPAPVPLGPGDPTQSDSEFTAAYAEGRSTNTARQLKWMRDHGVPT